LLDLRHFAPKPLETPHRIPENARNQPRSVGGELRERRDFGGRVGNVERAAAHRRPSGPEAKWGIGANQDRAFLPLRRPQEGFFGLGKAWGTD